MWDDGMQNIAELIREVAKHEASVEGDKMKQEDGESEEEELLSEEPSNTARINMQSR